MGRMILYNSLARKKEDFAPREGKRVNLFVCGPTVYDYSHIGHARTYLVYDGLVKFMRQRLGWDIFYLQNITDLEDKIMRRAAEQNRDPLELAKNLTAAHLEDMKALGIDSVNTYAPATDYIPEIISQVERLLAKKFAYIIDGDGVYFDVKIFKNYGKLSRRTAEMAEDSVSRIDESINKKNKADFALWKYSKSGEPSWDAPFGSGRPGWHIEDTAISEKFFGSSYDIHGGGLDLIFPHHEAEIAQMESLSGVPIVRIWTHIGMLTVKREKMAKSVGNVITIRDFLAKNSPAALRMFVFSSHYRSPVDYTEEGLRESLARIERLQEFAAKLATVAENNAVSLSTGEFINSFWQELEDDFNTPNALARLFELVGAANKAINEHRFSSQDAQKVARFLDEINGILGILPRAEFEIPDKIKKLVEKREKLRGSSEFARADEIRQKIDEAGYEVSDTSGGPVVRKK